MDQVPIGNKAPRPGHARQFWCPACRGLLANPLALVTRLPDDDDLPALLLLVPLLLLLLLLLLLPRVPLVPGHLPGVVDHTTGHHVLRFPLLGPVDRVISLRHSHHDNNTAT